MVVFVSVLTKTKTEIETYDNQRGLCSCCFVEYSAGVSFSLFLLLHFLIYKISRIPPQRKCLIQSLVLLE